MEAAAAVPRQTNAITISVEALRHVYKGGTVALDGVDLSFGTGLFGLLGPNGAGKSTLMRIMCTLLIPTSGRVNRREVRALLGYLPQEFGAWRLHRVEEVVDTLARLSGMGDKAARKRRVAEVLEQVGLHEVADRKVKKLSGGMVRRLGVAQALVHEPQVIVVDEPTVGLDPQERLRFRQVMANLSRDRTIVLSTHIVADLGSTCNDLALIDRGKIVFRGSPADLVEPSRGRVFQVQLASGAEGDLGPGYEVVSRTRDAAGTRLRAVSVDDKLPEGAQAVDDPTLEEAYLAFMAARGRVDAALVDDEERPADEQEEKA
jgi:ABC-type multidrug transport system ATPase subunit